MSLNSQAFDNFSSLFGVTLFVSLRFSLYAILSSIQALSMCMQRLKIAIHIIIFCKLYVSPLKIQPNDLKKLAWAYQASK